ncbi:MAG TPA: YebC/PmpR family DNA-binding transcriptional regulator, partial [Tahibacter sp.]|nr:YebC/PmpR family DNA-binding transcriptional regulator [Tahibacter sp.]
EGSVAFMFKKLGVLSYAPGANEDRIMDAALEAGADDVVVYAEDGSIDVVTSPDAFEAVRAAMDKAGLKPDRTEVTLRADNDVAVSGDAAKAVAKIIDWLEDIDDVQHVYTNADLSADAYE